MAAQKAGATPVQLTEVLTGRKKVVGAALGFFANAKTRMDIAAGVLSPARAPLPPEVENMGREYLEGLAKRGVRRRIVCEITEGNLAYCKELARGIALRHVQGVSSYFGVSDSEYVASPGTQEFNPDGPLLYSNEGTFVRHHQLLFETLWGVATPADDRFRELESGVVPSKTEVVRGTEAVMAAMARALERATGTIRTYAEPSAPKFLYETEGYRKLLSAAKSRRVKLKYITEITKGNAEYCRRMMVELSAELRHVDGLRGSFTVTDTDWVATTSGIAEDQQIPEMICSNMPQIVHRNIYLFDNLWERAIPADIRLAALEKGEQLGETKLTFSTREILDSADGFVDSMRDEALVIVSREGSIRDNAALFRRIADKAATKGVTVKILGRFSSEEGPILKEFQSAGVQVRSMSGGKITNLSLGIYDRNGMGLVQYVYPDVKRPPGQTYLVGVISTSRQMIAGIAAIFDSLWEESELRQRAELMQDILVHDVRNYNQVTRANLELLREKLSDEKAERYADWALGSIDGSTELIQKTRMLANVLTGEVPQLSGVSLGESIERSISLVRQIFREKAVTVSGSAIPSAKVFADSLLDEVFINIFSNAVKYTDGGEVPLEIQVRDEDGSPAKGKYLVVSVVDHGRGIPDDMKDKVATRYLGTAKGRGLGLSIAHALVVHRYSGRMELKNRVEQDYSKGTMVEIWLARA